jgi:hypothetical protein
MATAIMLHGVIQAVAATELAATLMARDATQSTLDGATSVDATEEALHFWNTEDVRCLHLAPDGRVRVIPSHSYHGGALEERVRQILADDVARTSDEIGAAANMHDKAVGGCLAALLDAREIEPAAAAEPKRYQRRPPQSVKSVRVGEPFDVSDLRAGEGRLVIADQPATEAPLAPVPTELPRGALRYATVIELAARVQEPVTSERELTAILQRLAHLARDADDFSLGLCLNILAEDPPELAAAWSGRLRRLGAKVTRPTKPDLCRIAADALRHWEDEESRAQGIEPSLILGQGVSYKGQEVSVILAIYPNGRTLLRLEDAQGEHLVTLTTDKGETPPARGEIHVEAHGDNERAARAVLAAGLFEDTGKRVRAGFVQAQVWRMVNRGAS